MNQLQLNRAIRSATLGARPGDIHYLSVFSETRRPDLGLAPAYRWHVFMLVVKRGRGRPFARTLGYGARDTRTEAIRAALATLRRRP